MDESEKHFTELETACPIPILILALIEARRYRWNKSVEKNQDAGEGSILEWFKLNFKKWYRKHWADHLEGSCYYEGFGSEEFNISSSAKEDKQLVSTMISFITQEGNTGENLGIICWAQEFGADIDKVIKYLRKININNKRFSWDTESLGIICLALREADRYKWIESQKAGKDLGEKAILDWFKIHWCNWKKDNFSNFYRKSS